MAAISSTSLTSRSTPLRTARWAATLFGLAVATQRLSVPGMEVPLLLPVVFGWLAVGVLQGVVEPDRYRITAWGVVVAVTGTAMALQSALVTGRLISVSSWALVLTVSLPMTFRLRDRSAAAFRQTLGYVQRIGSALAALCLVMTGSQLLGVRYSDIVASVLPDVLELRGYVITYPYSYGSELYRANAWLGLEPSFVSFQLGLALLCALLLRANIASVLLIAAGLVSTASGSGILIVVVGLLVLLARRRRRVLTRFVAPLSIAIVALLATPYGQSLLARVQEPSEPGSSASLRMVEPYFRLWPSWSADPLAVLFGLGPGSSQQLVDRVRLPGLLVPTPAKIFVEYGVFAGLVLAAFILLCYVGGPSPTLAATIFVSLWTIQPGLTTMLLVVNVVVFVSLWSPRSGPRLDDMGVDEIASGARGSPIRTPVAAPHGARR